MKIPEYNDPCDLVRTISPKMPAEQIVAQINEFNRIEHNKTQVPVDDARRQQLQDNGFNPADWTWYSNTSRLHDQSDESMLQGLASNFPEEVEFLVIQGSYLGGVTVVPGGAAFGAIQYSFNPEGYTAYVRVRPKQLRG